jgi:Protein kinase domain
MIRREISPNDVLRDGVFAFESFSNSPREGQPVNLTAWALYDSGRCREAFDAGYTVYQGLERQLQEKDSVRLTHDDVARLTGLASDGEELHRVLWILHRRWGGSWDDKVVRNDWVMDFNVGMTTFPRPNLEQLFLTRLQGASPQEAAMVATTELLPRPLVSGELTSPFETSTGGGQQFRIDRKLGDGVYADVWLAQDTALDRLVAVKIVRPETPGAQDALAHARALARVQHPNIVTVYQVVEGLSDPLTNTSVTAVVMEYVAGPSLEEVLGGPPLEATRTLRIGVGLAAAIVAYHERGLAHTDLHDGNVVVSGSVAKVLDPLYFETALMQSTGSRKGLQARDGRNLRDLLTRLLRKANAPNDSLLRLIDIDAHDLTGLQGMFTEALERLAGGQSGVVLERLTAKKVSSPSPSDRSPALSLVWTEPEDWDATEERSPAAIVANSLELPASPVSLDEMTLVLSEEIKDAQEMLQRSGLSRHHEKLERYRRRCEAFLADVQDERSFNDWYVREYWDAGSRWFSISVVNDGSLPASRVHARLAGTPWLRFYDKKPRLDGPVLPRRPEFYPSISHEFGMLRASMPELMHLDVSRFVVTGDRALDRSRVLSLRREFPHF